MQNIAELKSVIQNAADEEGFPVSFIPIKNDPDLYGDESEDVYLPLFISEPPVSMFLEIFKSTNESVDYHYEIVSDGNIIDEFYSEFNVGDAEPKICEIVHDLKDYMQ